MDLPKSSDERTPFNWEEFLFKFRKPILFLLTGITLLGIGIFIQKQKRVNEGIEILESVESEKESFIIAEISGAVEKPGVYKFESGARVEDLIIASGGISAVADRSWLEKYLNRAAKLTDGQKVFIPTVNEQSKETNAKNVEGYQTISADFSSQNQGFVNINTASQEELESLWGIGPVYAKKIIEQRPYSNNEELLTKKVIPKNTYEKIKDQVTVY